MQTVFSFWWDLEKFQQKCVPSYTFFRCGDYLKFLMGLGQIFTKRCAQSYVSWLWRLTWDFDGTWKNFHKKVYPVTRFFAVETNLSFWCNLESFDKKVWPVTHFFRSADCLQFLMGLRKISTKMCAQLHVFSLWRLSQVFDALGQIFTKKCAQSYVSWLWRLTWDFDGTWKNFHKKVCPVTRFFAVETNLSFWWDLEKCSKKCAQSQVSSLCRLSQVFDGTWKNFHKKVCPVTRFVRCRD